MTTTRIMPGLLNMEGRVVNSLRIEKMIARHPQPRYETTCERCGTRSTASQDALTSGAARCRADACGKPVRVRSRDLTEERKRIAEREAERLAEESELSERRMAAETEDWERPSKYAPEPDLQPSMSERERLAARERREQEEQERRAAEAPRLEAERRANEEQAAREAAEQARKEKRIAIERELVQEVSDPKLYVSPAMRSASMPQAEAERFTTQQAEQFAQSPEYVPYRSLENADVILSYLRRNGIHIADVETIRAAFRRLRDLGLLKQKPAPAAAAPVEQPRQSRPPIDRPSTAVQPKTYRGRDYATGRERDFTQREVDRMSSLEFQRAFKVVPSVRDLFAVMGESR